MAKTVWEHVTFAESDSKPGKEYAIDRRVPDGVLRCACERFRFTRGQLGTTAKTCHHIDAWRASGEQVDTPIVRQHLTQRASIVTGTRVVSETFTFRRAIAFGTLT